MNTEGEYNDSCNELGNKYKEKKSSLGVYTYVIFMTLIGILAIFL